MAGTSESNRLVNDRSRPGAYEQICASRLVGEARCSLCADEDISACVEIDTVRGPSSVAPSPAKFFNSI